MQRFALPLLALGALMLPHLARAQCSKPPVPQNGFPLTSSRDNLVTYSDGYKTKGDLYLPSGTPPSCGWPLAIPYLPGFPAPGAVGTTRTEIAGMCRWFAGQGYAVWTFDIRGLGETRTLNSGGIGFDGAGAQMKFDMAEQVAFVRSHWIGSVSQTKFGVGGPDFGYQAAYAMATASVSGKMITVAGRGTITCPTVDALYSYDAPEPIEYFLKGGTLFHPLYVGLSFAPYSILPVKWDTAWQTLNQNGFLNQTPEVVQAAWASDPLRLSLPDLQNTSVPFFVGNDSVEAPEASLRELEFVASLPASTPRLVFTGRGGSNGGLSFRTQVVRWYDRFLWNVQNGIDQEGRMVVGTLRLAAIESEAALRRYDDSYPPADIVPQRAYLTDAGTLSTNPPSNTYTPAVVSNQVAGGYDQFAYLGDMSLQTLLQKIPLSESTYTLPALAADAEFGERPRVSLSVVPDSARFVLCALLVGTSPGVPREIALCQLGRGIINATPNQPMRVDLDLPPIGVRMPAGSVLKLVIRNHWIGVDPLPAGLQAVPYFLNANTKIRLGNGVEASYVDLPFRKTIRAGMFTGTPELRLSGPTQVWLGIDGGLARAGQTYFTLCSLSGWTPGIPIPGVGTIPIHQDGLTNVGLGLPNALPFFNFLGTLGPLGTATPIFYAGVLLPLPPALLGLRFSFASLIWSGTSLANAAITNAVDVWVR